MHCAHFSCSLGKPSLVTSPDFLPLILFFLSSFLYLYSYFFHFFPWIKNKNWFFLEEDPLSSGTVSILPSVYAGKGQFWPLLSCFTQSISLHITRFPPSLCCDIHRLVMNLTFMSNALVVSGKCCSPRHLTCPPWHLKPSQVQFSQRDCWGQRQLHGRRRGCFSLTDSWFLCARPCRSGCAPALVSWDHSSWPETGRRHQLCLGAGCSTLL